MPWKETSAMEERMKFIVDYLEGEDSLSGLCQAYGISRPTAYKWIERYKEEGPSGLEDRSRAPQRQAQAVSREVEEAVEEMRERYPNMGPKKLRIKLVEQNGEICWPALSTIGEILKRKGLVVSRRRRGRSCPSEHPLTGMSECNRVWGVDFKGDVHLRSQERCIPLTVMDGHSRYLLGCQSLQKTTSQVVRAVFERLFREYGLPEVIRSDNGAPFASVGIGGLTPLSVWWIRLGIVPERIEPGKPQQNGRHERMHRTLKAETTKPAASTLRVQQKRFDRFRQEYNEERPHESLGQIPPGRIYQPSPREYKGKTPDWHYPETMWVRRVKRSGEISWQNRHYYVSESLAGELLGVEDIGTSQMRICLGELILGILDLDRMKIERARVLQKREEL